MVQDTTKGGEARQVVIFRSIREERRRLLSYYVVDDDSPSGAYDCFEWLCEETSMEQCRFVQASAEAILATITEPPRDLDFDQAFDLLTVELERAAQDEGRRTLFGYVRKRSCVSDETMH